MRLRPTTQRWSASRRYWTYAMAYETVIKAEMNKVEVYKALLQAEQTKV
jgi:hypothetical protein